MDDRYHAFEAYLRGELPEAERQQLEEKLLDEQWQLDFAQYKQMRTAIANRLARESEVQVLRDQFRQLGETYLNVPPRRLTGRISWLVAASICLLLGVGMYLLQQRSGTDQVLISSFIEERPLPGVRGGDGLFAYPKALLAYEEGQWEEAARGLESIPSSSDVYLDAQLFAGYAWLKAEDYASAKERFQLVFDASPHPFQQENAAWHLALIQVIVEQPGTKDLILAPYLADEDHPFHQMAIRLDKKLDRRAY